MTDNLVLRLSDLPVEVLCMIFSNTDSADRVNLAQVCERFDFVLQRRELNRSVDLRRAYELDVNKIDSYLKDKTRCNFITSVNFTSCYWIPSPTLKKFLMRLKNLETMLVADTKLTTSALEALVVALPKVKSIAFSWNGPVDIGQRTEDLQSIYIYVPTLEKEPSPDIFNFLKLCTSIEQISIVASTIPNVQKSIKFLDYRHQKMFHPYLRYFLLKAERGFSDDFSEALNRGSFNDRNKSCLVYLLISSTKSKSNSDWKSFWIPFDLTRTTFGESAIVYLRRNLGNSGYEEEVPIMDRVHIARPVYEHLSMLDDSVLHSLSKQRALFKLRSLSIYCGSRDIDVVIPSLFREGCQLEELNLYGHYDRKVLPLCRNVADSLSSHRLRKLCIPACAIWRKKAAQSTSSKARSQGFGKGPRVSHLTVNESPPCTPFLNLVRSCPNIEVFVMDNTERDFLVSTLPDDYEWDPEQLSHITNWAKLRKLTLGGIPISSFTFLHKIGQSCPYVTSLTLNYLHLTASAFNMSGLVKALPVFTALEDLVIRQPKGISVLHSLRQETLRRVLLICNNVFGSDINELLAKCARVVFLYVVCGITKEGIKRIRSYVEKRFAHRQALIFHIVPLDKHRSQDERREHEATTVPGIHANEMLTGEVLIGGPLSGENYIQCE